MEQRNLLLIHKCANGMWLELAKINEYLAKNEVAQKALEIDLPNKRWRYINQYPCAQSTDWNAIGNGYQNGDGKEVHLVFDQTDFTQLKTAFSTASHFYSSNHMQD